MMEENTPHPPEPAGPDFKLGPWLVQPSLQRLVRDDVERPLGPTVLGVLLSLAKRPGEAVCKDELIADAWLGEAATDEALTTAVYELRKALDDDARKPSFVATIRGRGYRLLVEPSPLPAPAATPPRNEASTKTKTSSEIPVQETAEEAPPVWHIQVGPSQDGTDEHAPLRPRRPKPARRRRAPLASAAVAAGIATLVALLGAVVTEAPQPRPTIAESAAAQVSPLLDSSATPIPSRVGRAPSSIETENGVIHSSAAPAPSTGPAPRDALSSAEFPSIHLGGIPTESAAPELRSVAVMALEPRGEDPEAFALGLSERVAIDLARSDWLEVVPGFSRAFSAGLTSGGIDALVEGAVRRHGDEVTVTVQLVSALDGQLLWGGTWQRPLQDVAALESRLASEIARRVRGRLGSAAIIAHHPEIDEAIRLGQHFLDGATPDRARRFFSFALERQPTLASAHAGLAETYLAEADGRPTLDVETEVDEARRSATTALEIDAELGAAHASIGAIALLHDGDLEAAAGHFEKAGLDFGAPVSSVRRFAAFLSAAGRHEEAIERLVDAVHRAPASLEARLDLVRALYLARRFEAALHELETLRQLAPYDPRPARLESDVLLVSGDLEAAVAACRRALELAGGPRDVSEAMEHVFEQAGLPGVIRCLQEIAAETAAQDPSFGLLMDPLRLARFEAVRGDGESAMHQLRAAKRQGSPELVWLGVDPAFDGLRQRPDFADLLAEGRS